MFSIPIPRELLPIAWLLHNKDCHTIDTHSERCIVCGKSRDQRYPPTNNRY